MGDRIDHFTRDAKRKRVIGAALGNNTVEVVDTLSGRDIHSITGAAVPQGVVYVGEIDRLFVANGTDGKLSGHAPACGTNNETGFIWLSRPVPRRPQPYGCTRPKTE